MMENIHLLYMDLVIIGGIIVLLLVLLVLLQKKKESFQNPECSFTVNVRNATTGKTVNTKMTVSTYLTKYPVMKSVGNIPANYDSNVTTQSAQRRAELDIAKADIKLFKDVVSALYKQRNKCTNDYITLCNAYASQNGMMGGTTEQGQFEAIQIGLQMAGTYLVITNTSGKQYGQIESWIAALNQRFAPSLGGRANNQFLFYTAGMMCAAILQKDRKSLQDMANSLLQHMRTPSGKGNFKKGFILSELDRYAKVIGYHSYYITYLWCNLVVVKFMNISFPWEEFKEPLRRVCASLADKSTNTKGDASLFINFLKTQTGHPMNTYNDATVYNEMRTKTITNGDVHMKMWQYLFNNGSVPPGFIVYGVETRLFVSALQYWNKSVFPTSAPVPLKLK